MAKSKKGIEDQDNEELDSTQPTTTTTAADLPPRKQLPKELQATLNDEEKLWELLYDGAGEDTTETPIRYAAYASRIRTIMLSAHRYVAYTSDIGESFRPIAHPWLVKGAYGVSWVYLAGDVAHEGYKAYVRNQRVLYPELHLARSSGESGEGEGGTKRDPGLLSSLKQTVGGTASAENTSDPHYENTGRALTGGHIVAGRVPALEDYRAVMAQRAVFQAVASMGLPAFTIHSIVRYSGRALKDARNRTVRTWGPIGLGLAAVPFLPFVFDEPVEHATEWLFYNAFRTFGGEEAVQGRAVMGAKEVSQMKKEL